MHHSDAISWHSNRLKIDRWTVSNPTAREREREITSQRIEYQMVFIAGISIAFYFLFGVIKITSTPIKRVISNEGVKTCIESNKNKHKIVTSLVPLTYWIQKLTYIHSGFDSFYNILNESPILNESFNRFMSNWCAKNKFTSILNDGMLLDVVANSYYSEIRCQRCQLIPVHINSKANKTEYYDVLYQLTDEKFTWSNVL